MHSATYKRWNNNYVIYAITYRCTKILVEIAAQTSECDPKWNSCSKNNFFPLWVTVFLRVFLRVLLKPFFSEFNVSLFHKRSCAKPFLNRYGIFQNHKLQISNLFDRYFYLRCTAISKEQLQSHIWVVPLLFQDTTSNDLGYYVYLKQTLAVVLFFTGIELIHN